MEFVGVCCVYANVLVKGNADRQRPKDTLKVYSAW